MKGDIFYRGLLLLSILVNAIGLFPELIMGDSALYANVSKEMIENRDLVNLYRNSIDWLDKPHFQFWFSALWMKIFGLNYFAYKFASFLFYLISLRYCYLLTKAYYSEKIAISATIILSCALHVVISNSDVRAEAYLMGTVIAATFYLSRMIVRANWSNILLAGFFCGLAVLTKGIFTLIPVFFAYVGLLLTHPQEKWFHWKWISVAGICFLLTIPELYTLYVQFDLHPEKLVYGEKNVSGIRFFLWDSQFGRFINTGPIKGSGHPLFFVQVMLWAFAPMGVIFYVAAFRHVQGVMQKRAKELFSILGFGVLFLIFSLSRFQLAHYLNIIFPFAAIITASFLVNSSDKKVKWISAILWIQLVLFAFAAIAFGVFCYSSVNLLALGSGVLTIGLSILYWKIKSPLRRWLYITVLCSTLSGVFLNSVYYPFVLPYQSGTACAKSLNERIDSSEILLGTNSFLFEFYYKGEVTHLDTSLSINSQAPDGLMYGDHKFQEYLDEHNVNYLKIDSFPHFHTTKMNGNFLDPKKRHEHWRYRYLFELRN